MDKTTFGEVLFEYKMPKPKDFLL